MKKKILTMFTVATFTAMSFACSNSEAKIADATPEVVKKETVTPVAKNDVVDVITGSEDHTTLATAVTTAGLVETLKGAGPFTIFAPTNAAFAALPAGTVEGLLKPESKVDLTNILTYHVVAGAVKAADLKDGQMIKTLQGDDLVVSIKDGKVMINGANVTAADLEGTNGVVHVIDAVLIPKK